MSEQWYWSSNKAQQGPVSSSKLRILVGTGRLKPSDLVWREGMPKWVSAGSIEGLFATSPTAVPEVPPPVPVPADPKVRFKIPAYLHTWPAAVVGLTCCFPIGHLLVWTHPLWTNSQKTMWSGGWLLAMILTSNISEKLDHTPRPAGQPSSMEIADSSPPRADQAALPASGPPRAAIIDSGTAESAFRNVVKKYKNGPDEFASTETREKYNTELRQIQNYFVGLKFDPTENRAEARSIIELFQKEVEGSYSGRLYDELEGHISGMYEKLRL